MLNRMQGEKCPCNGCITKRTETCHATCKEFLEWDKAYRAKREAELNDRHMKGQADYRKKTAVTKYYRRTRRDGLLTK